jgi:hypothetical protein
MSQLVKITRNFSEEPFFNEDNFYRLYQYLKKNKLVSVYFNGQKYFFFALKGRIFHLSELQLSLILSTITFMSIIGIRKVFKKIKFRKKILNLVKAIRGGNSSNSIIDLVDENDILHYEEPIPDVLEYNPISISHLNLTSKQKFIKSIIKKCLKPGLIYKITHRGVLEILDKMMHFKKSDQIKIISYDVLVLSLILASKPLSQVTYQGTAEIFKKIVSPFALEHFPTISAVLTAASLAFQANLNAGFYGFSLNIGFMLVKAIGAHRAAELLRSHYFIDCTDYVKQLPQANPKELPYAKTLTELDSSSSSSSKNRISYTREEPTRHDAFVSTSPHQQLHYQEEIKIETLDGEIRRVNTLKGPTIQNMRNRQPEKLIQSDYIPLNERTRTLDDVKSLDSTLDRQSAGEITKTILEEQIKASLIRESLNGE